MKGLFARDEDHDLGSIVAPAEQRSLDLASDRRNVDDGRRLFGRLPHADESPCPRRRPRERRRDRAAEIGIRRRIERLETALANHERVLPGEGAPGVRVRTDHATAAIEVNHADRDGVLDGSARVTLGADEREAVADLHGTPQMRQKKGQQLDLGVTERRAGRPPVERGDRIRPRRAIDPAKIPSSIPARASTLL